MTETTQEERMRALRHMMDYPWDYEIDIEWAQKLIRDAEQAEARNRELEAALRETRERNAKLRQIAGLDPVDATPPPDSNPAEGEGGGVIHEAAPISPAAWEAAGSVTPPQRRDALEELDSMWDAAGQDLLDPEYQRIRRALSAPAVPEAINVRTCVRGGTCMCSAHDAQPRVLFHGAHKMVVCVPDRWDDAQVQNFASRENPLSGYWSVSSSRVSCDEREGYVHVVLDG